MVVIIISQLTCRSNDEIIKNEREWGTLVPIIVIVDAIVVEKCSATIVGLGASTTRLSLPLGAELGTRACGVCDSLTNFLQLRLLPLVSHLDGQRKESWEWAHQRRCQEFDTLPTKIIICSISKWLIINQLEYGNASLQRWCFISSGKRLLGGCL
jgi:hypothetical protein